MNKIYEVTTLCNALVDVVYSASDNLLEKYNLKKGIMHLLSYEQQQSLIRELVNDRQAIELGGSALNTIRALSMLGKKTLQVLYLMILLEKWLKIA